MIGIEWVLVICTQGWVLCGQIREHIYPSEESCYRAMGELYRRHGHDAYKYIICRPATSEDKQP